MAIDNAEKRRSISGIGGGIPGVTPNASKDVEWRQQAGRGYSGIAPSPVVPSLAKFFVLLRRRRRYRVN